MVFSCFWNCLNGELTSVLKRLLISRFGISEQIYEEVRLKVLEAAKSPRKDKEEWVSMEMGVSTIVVKLVYEILRKEGRV